MSFAVMTGPPTKAQLYLDTILDDLVAETKQEQDRYSLAKLLFKCLRDHPDEIRQIDSSTGHSETNKQVRDKAIRTALAIQAAGLKPQDKVLIISRNHLDLSGPYYGCLFGGFVLFPLHVGITTNELQHFISLSDPRLIFTDQDNVRAVEQTIEEINIKIPIVMLGPNINSQHKTLPQFMEEIEDQRINDFWPINSNDANNTVMLLCTSGSTNLPKAVMITSIRLVSQLATMWYKDDIFPKTTRSFFYPSTAYSMSYTMIATSTLVYRIPILTISEQLSVCNIRTIFRKYQILRQFIHDRPGLLKVLKYKRKNTFIQQTFMEPRAFATLVHQSGGNLGDFSCLDKLFVGGSPLTEPIYKVIKAQVGPRTEVINGFGMTEAQGFVLYPGHDTPYRSSGKIINTIIFKIVDESGNTLAPNQPGELYLQSKNALFKGYLNNEETTKESFTEDGWFKTGDIFYVDETGDLFFIERIKFIITFHNLKISPTELESLICGIEGVEAAAVCGANNGPGALVQVKPGFDLNAQTIHEKNNSSLSDFKRLRSGIVFVSSMPLLPNGKLDRNRTKVLFVHSFENDIHYDKFMK